MQFKIKSRYQDVSRFYPNRVGKAVSDEAIYVNTLSYNAAALQLAITGHLDLRAHQSDIEKMKQDVVRSDLLAVELSNRLFFRLYQCANMLHKTGTKALERHGVTTQQWGILGALSDKQADGGIPVGVLAARLMVSRQNLLGVLSRLEAQGLVARTVDSRDSRSRRIGLTEQGRETWIAMQDDIASYYAAALRGFSNDDLIHALHYMDKMRDNFCDVDALQSDQGSD